MPQDLEAALCYEAPPGEAAGLAESAGARDAGAAEPLSVGAGDIDGLVIAVPLSAGVLTGVATTEGAGISGADVSGWIGIGVVFGASCTGVAFGCGVSGAAGGNGVRSQAAMETASNSTRIIFMTRLPNKGT